MLGQPGRAGCVGMWLVGPVGGRFWSGYLWMGCFCWLDYFFWVPGGLRGAFCGDVPYPRGAASQNWHTLARLRASTKTRATASNIQPHPPARIPTASSQSSRPLHSFRRSKTPSKKRERDGFAKAASPNVSAPPRHRAGLPGLLAGLIGLEPRFDRCAAPLDVVYTFIWPDLCVGKRHRPLTRYRGQTARPPSTERQPSFTQTRP